MTISGHGRQMAGLAACLCVAAGLLASPASGGTPTFRAVIAGVSQYEYLNSLSYCDDDVRDMRDALLQDPRWLPENITILTDGESQLATRANIQSAIAAMAAAAAADDVCIFYFSGHGAYDTDDGTDEADGLDEFICPQDMDVFDYSTGIRDDELQVWINAITSKNARAIVILDTCHSGGNVKSATSRVVKGIGPPRPPSRDYDGFAEDLVQATATKDLNNVPTNIAVLTACDDHELSTESWDLMNGAFTYHLLEGMNSCLTDAPGMGNSNGQISLSELNAYVAPRAAAYCDLFGSWRQHAQFHNGGAGSVGFYDAPPASDVTIASVSMHLDPGWTTEGLWAWGQNTGGPVGLGQHDPTSGHTGNSVYGYNLSGGYANSMPVHYLTSKAFNCSNYKRVKLRFWRWLGVEMNVWDEAGIQVSNDGGVSWHNMWANPYDLDISDTEWVHMEYDISAYADTKSDVRIRWSLGTTDSIYTCCGWNIDDVTLVGAQIGGIAADPLSLGQVVTPPMPILTPTQTFDVWNSVGPTLVDYTISVDYGTSPSSIIGLSDTSGDSTGPGDVDTITVTYDNTGLAEGTYTATIVVQCAYNQVQIPVVLEVTPPLIAANTATLTQECRWNDTAVAQSFNVWNSGAGELKFEATVAYTVGDPGWITGFPVDGSSTGQDDSVTVNVVYDTDALAAGTYEATIDIHDNPGDPTSPPPGNGPLTVAVTLTVTRPTIGITLQATNPLTVVVDPFTLEVPCHTGTDAPLETFGISNAETPVKGTGVLEFAVSDDAGWLEVFPASGTAAEIIDPAKYTPTPVDLIFNASGETGPTDSDPLPTTPNILTATVTVSDPIATNNPLSFTVNLKIDGDHDQDGLLNYQELDPSIGTDPAVADTDGDGLLDGEEVLRYETDPLDWDHDDDGFSDGDEVAAMTNPKVAGHHPLLVLSPIGGGGCVGGGGNAPLGTAIAMLLGWLALAFVLRARARLAVARNWRGGRS